MGKNSPVLVNLRSLQGWSKGHRSAQRRLTSFLPAPAKSNKVTDCHKLLCQILSGIYLTEELHALMTKNAELVKTQKSLGFSTDYFGPKAIQPVQTHPRPQQSKPITQGRKYSKRDTGNNKALPAGRGVGDIYRFQRRLLSYTHSKPVQGVPAFSCPGSNLPI